MTDSKPLEVMFFLPELGNGGAEMNAVRLAEGLLEGGVRPTYVVTTGPGSYAKFLPDGVETVVLPRHAMRSASLRLLFSRGALAKLIDDRRPDIVCPVMPLPSLALLSILDKCTHRPKVVLSIQNALKGAVFGNSEGIARLQSFLIPRLWPKADKVIALSQGVADEVKELVPALAEKTEVIPNVGMPLESQISEAARAPRRPQSDRPITFVACGRLNTQKGYPYMLKAFAKVAAEHESVLNIVGVGRLKRDLEDLANDLGVSEKVSFLGFQDDPLVHMKEADIFVLSSLWEGFGNVIVEAMAMGTPVISTDCKHGPSEIITHEQDGLLVKPADVDDLAAAMLRLARSETDRSRLGKAGLKRSADFSMEKIAALYAASFHRICGAA